MPKEASDDPWWRFCEELKQAGRVLQREATPSDEVTRAEGYRYLVRMLRLGWERTHEYADAVHPQLFEGQTATMLQGGVTSDARYHEAVIDGSETYRICGTRGEALLMELTAYAGQIGLRDASRQEGFLTEQDLEVGPDGRFEVRVGPEAQPRNWVRTTGDVDSLLIRQYAHDWRHTTGASLSIERLGEPKPMAPTTLEAVTTALARTAAFVPRVAETWASIVDLGRRRPNRLVAVGQDQDLTMPGGHRFASGRFELAPDEALVIDFTSPEVPYWGFQLTNYWFEPLDFGGVGSHVNNRTVEVGKDRAVRLVVADVKSERPNWLYTRGERVGTMTFRLARSPKEPIPAFDVRLVPLAGLV